MYKYCKKTDSGLKTHPASHFYTKFKILIQKKKIIQQIYLLLNFVSFLWLFPVFICEDLNGFLSLCLVIIELEVNAWLAAIETQFDAELASPLPEEIIKKFLYFSLCSNNFRIIICVSSSCSFTCLWRWELAFKKTIFYLLKIKII